jgi:hypothetical protein
MHDRRLHKDLDSVANQSQTQDVAASLATDAQCKKCTLLERAPCAKPVGARLPAKIGTFSAMVG